MKSKSLSAVAVSRPMSAADAAVFHLQKLGKPFGAWHKRKGPGRSYGGVPFNIGRNRKKRSRRARLNSLCVCGRKLKNCAGH